MPQIHFAHKIYSLKFSTKILFLVFYINHFNNENNYSSDYPIISPLPQKAKEGLFSTLLNHHDNYDNPENPTYDLFLVNKNQHTPGLNKTTLHQREETY